MELVNSYIFQSGLIVTIQVVTMDFGFWVQNTILRFFQVSLKSFFTTTKKEKEKEKKIRVKKKIQYHCTHPLCWWPHRETHKRHPYSIFIK